MSFLTAVSIDASGSIPLPFIILGIVVAIAIFGHYQEKKRREALQAVASQLGFSFNHEKNHSFASQYGFLNHLNSGSNRYAYNIMQGHAPDGSPSSIFDYHYETHSRNSKGHRKTHHHYYSVYTLILPKPFSEIEIKPEGFFSKFTQAIGFEDIDFESMEFSKRYQVKSKDKKYAYDICNAQMIDYLLKQPDLTIEIEHNVLAITYNKRLVPESIPTNLDRLTQIRALIPDYLLDSTPPPPIPA